MLLGLSENCCIQFNQLDLYYKKENNKGLLSILYGSLEDLNFLLIKMLAFSGMIEEAIDVFNRVNYVLKGKPGYISYKNINLSIDDNIENIKILIKTAEKKEDSRLITILNLVYGLKKPRIVINHFRKAENCLRLGIINEEVYKKSINRLLKNNDALKNKENILNAYINSNVFEKIPFDSFSNQELSNNKDVKWAENFFSYSRDLSDDQKTEYIKAFSKESTYQLLCKYQGIRFKGIIYSLIFINEGILNIKNIVNELELYIKIDTKYVQKSLYEHAINICHELENLSSNEKFSKLLVIKYLAAIFTAKVNEGGAEDNYIIDWNSGIILSESYSSSYKKLTFDKYLIKTSKTKSISVSGPEAIDLWHPAIYAKILNIDMMSIDKLKKLSLNIESIDLNNLSEIKNIEHSSFNTDYTIYFSPFMVIGNNLLHDNPILGIVDDNIVYSNNNFYKKYRFDVYTNESVALNETAIKDDISVDIIINFNNYNNIKFELVSARHISKLTGISYVEICNCLDKMENNEIIKAILQEFNYSELENDDNFIIKMTRIGRNIVSAITSRD